MLPRTNYFYLLFYKFDLGHIMSWAINIRPAGLFRSKKINVHLFKLFNHLVGGGALRQLL